MKLIWFFNKMHLVLYMRTSVGTSAAFYVSQRGRIFLLSWTWTKIIIPQDHRIFCVDERVITAVQHIKFVSTSGISNFSRKGNMITLIARINATSTYVPPLIVFQIKNMNEELMDGAPVGWILTYHLRWLIRTYTIY